MAERSRALVASASACILVATLAPARADPPVVATDPPNAASGGFPSIGRFEIVQGVGRNPPLMLDTSNGTTWSLVPSGQPNDFGWVRVHVMDASEAAAARPSARAPDAGRLSRRRHPTGGASPARG